MPVHDELGKRMKNFYEDISKTKLMRRCPVILRIDGKAFHTFTRGMKRPFDDILIETMQETTKYLCEHIQGCVLGYTQSDEISLVLVDYKKLNSESWFDYEVQKLCSITSSMTTMAFNKLFMKNVEKYISTVPYYGSIYPCNKEEQKYIDVLNKAIENGAMFDTRCFNIPKEEVTNYIYWRQLDAIRNSIQMVGQSYFNYKQLHGKSCNTIQNMLCEQKGINWNDYLTYKKRGACVVKKLTFSEDSKNRKIKYKGDIVCNHWVIDKDIPIFKDENRDYIEKLINF